jgi:hypothetical protein
VAQPLLLLLQASRLLYRLLLFLPVGGQPPAVFLEVSQLLLEPREAFGGGLVRLLPQRRSLDFELHDAAFDLVELRRHRVDLHAQLRRGLVDQVDRLVRQEPIRDVAVREDRRRHQRRVLEGHAVVYFVPLSQAPQDADGVFHARLAHYDRLEPAFERGVLLDVLAVLVERRGADRVQLTPGQHRLEHVRRVDGAFGGPGTDNGVQLVDEEDYAALTP